MPVSNELPGYDDWKGREPDVPVESYETLGEAPLWAILRVAETRCEDSQLSCALARWLCSNACLFDKAWRDEVAALVSDQLYQLGVRWVPRTIEEIEADREAARDHAADRAMDKIADGGEGR